VDVGFGSVVLCNELNRVYINSWMPSLCNPVFKGEFYPKFVSFELLVYGWWDSSSHLSLSYLVCNMNTLWVVSRKRERDAE